MSNPTARRSFIKTILGVFASIPFFGFLSKSDGHISEVKTCQRPVWTNNFTPHVWANVPELNRFAPPTEDYNYFDFKEGYPKLSYWDGEKWAELDGNWLHIP